MMARGGDAKGRGVEGHLWARGIWTDSSWHRALPCAADTSVSACRSASLQQWPARMSCSFQALPIASALLLMPVQETQAAAVAAKHQTQTVCAVLQWDFPELPLVLRTGADLGCHGGEGSAAAAPVER